MRPRGRRFWMRKAEKAASFIGDLGEVEETEAFADYIEQITMFAGGGIGPFACRSPGAVMQPHEHRASRAIADVADLPVMALFMAIREVATTNRLSLPAETLRQLSGVKTGHQAASRSAMRSIGKRSTNLPIIPLPAAPTGTKKRNFHEMISLKSP